VPLVISELSDYTVPRWGQMTARRMVEHLEWTFAISVGNIKVPSDLSEEKLKEMKLFLFSKKKKSHDFMIPVLGKKTPKLVYHDLFEARDVLNKSIEQFYKYYEDNPQARHINPVFGELGFVAWEYVHFKHCYHHLTQFGLIEEGIIEE
jgi:oxepin-CoA hydrolase/3-oxo-5,6-dehydrosuberyl-CoA semialdehyde dehydrogenase